MLALGSSAPQFALRDVVSGTTVQRDLVRGMRGLLVMFLSRHCPYVKHVQDELARLGRDYADSGIGFVAIGSNDPTSHPMDAPDRLAEQAREVGFSFPYAFDETQEVARAFDAACTPDFFLYDRQMKLVYRGQLDDSRPNSGIPVTGRDLRAALEAVKHDRPVAPEQKPSIGCNIKWRS